MKHLSRAVTILSLIAAAALPAAAAAAPGWLPDRPETRMGGKIDAQTSGEHVISVSALADYARPGMPRSVCHMEIDIDGVPRISTTALVENFGVTASVPVHLEKGAHLYEMRMSCNRDTAVGAPVDFREWSNASSVDLVPPGSDTPKKIGEMRVIYSF